MKKALLVLFMILLGAACTRPKSATGDWMDRSIARDFQRFEKTGISKELLCKSWDACKEKCEFHRYQIIDSKVYGPESRIKMLLQALVKRYPVPNVDFIYYYEDRLRKSFFKRKNHRKGSPIFASAKNKALDRVILFADWTYDLSDETSGWNFLIQKINAMHSTCEWSQKIDKLFWRGKPWDGKHFEMYTFANWTTLPRGRLVAESKKDPTWIDAAFSAYPPLCAKEDLVRCVQEMGPIRYVSWEETLQHKYQMLIDGVTCAFPATQWKLLSGCLCFMQESEDIQYYYDELIPWTHYVPIKHDLSDLRDKLLWAKTHEPQTQAMAKSAREFALTHLMPEHILLYCYKVLLKYHSLQTFEPCLD